MQAFLYKLLLLIALCFSINLNAQKGGKKLKVDSSKNIHRTGIKLPCPNINKREEMIAKPLPYYNFYSLMEATYSFSDSSNQLNSKTDYTFYFNDSSYFAALKESYIQGGKPHTYFRIEELKDSMEFKIDLSDTGRLFQFKNTKNCKGTNSRFRSILENRATQFRKTGQAKMILGYNCEEYIFNNGQIKQTIWVIVDDDLWSIKIRKDMLTALYYEPVTFSKGLILFSETVTLHTGNKQTFKINTIQKSKPTRIVTSGFKLKSGA